MGLPELFGGGKVRALQETVTALGNQLEIVEENAYTAQAELMAEDIGWTRLLGNHDAEFTDTGRERIRQLCRMVAVANPIAKRGLNLRAAYIWGGGVQIAARATGVDKDGNAKGQDVNAVVQAFLDDSSNIVTWTGAQAREENERSGLGAEGELFVAHPTDPRTGRVQVRLIPVNEIVGIVSNPQDRDEPWFYVREWTQDAVRLDGTSQTSTHREAYPAIGYRPVQRPGRIDDVKVNWDAPVLHVKVNAQRGWTHGVPDLYASLQWARAYSEFLGDWIRLHKSLAEIAWRVSGKESKAQQARQRLQAGRDAAADGRPVGQIALTGEGVNIEAIPKTGATIDAGSGRPIAAAVAAGLEVPVTALLSDPGITGARATAETLDTPTELVMTMRRNLWTQVLTTQLRYVIERAAAAPQGPLKAQIKVVDRREVVVFADDTDTSLSIAWPDLTQTPLDKLVSAIVEADSTGRVPPRETARLLLVALGSENVDELIAEMIDPETGEFKDAELAASVAALQRAARGDGVDPPAPVPEDEDAGA